MELVTDNQNSSYHPDHQAASKIIGINNFNLSKSYLILRTRYCSIFSENLQRLHTFTKNISVLKNTFLTGTILLDDFFLI